MTTALSYATNSVAPTPEIRWVCSRGIEHRVLLLSFDEAGRAAPVGVAVVPNGTGAQRPELVEWVRVIAAELAAVSRP